MPIRNSLLPRITNNQQLMPPFPQKYVIMKNNHSRSIFKRWQPEIEGSDTHPTQGDKIRLQLLQKSLKN